MIFVARPIQCFVQVRGLFPPPKDDLDIPTAPVEFAHGLGGHFFTGNVRRHEVPLTTQSLGFAECVAFFLRLFPGCAEGPPGHFSGGADGDKPGFVAAFSKLYDVVDSVSLARPEMGIESAAVLITNDEV
jgi:hypothetical protein